MTLQGPNQSSKLIQWWLELLQRLTPAVALAPQHVPTTVTGEEGADSAKEDAKNRLKLVLMHDRTQLSPTLLESMRDELMQVISKYVEIDQTTMDLCLEQESNTIALVANISVVRSRNTSSSEGA